MAIGNTSLKLRCSSCQQTFISEEINRYEHKIIINICTKLWLASRSRHKIALAGLRPPGSLTLAVKLYKTVHEPI